MRSFFRNILVALPLVASVSYAEPGSPTKESRPIYANAHEAFRDLVDALPEESLRVALNSLTHFKAGVFESDRHGVERVHNENPPLATKLIVAAVQDLKKRQAPQPNNNGTQSQHPPQSSEPPSSNPPPPPSSSERSAVIVPVPITTTDGNGQATVVSSAILSDPTAVVVIPETRTNSRGEASVIQQTRPAVIFTATNSAGQPSVVTSAVEFAPTPGQVLTRTNDQGSAFVTTYTPPGGKVSKIVLITTTNDQGQPSVITSYTFVEPAAATGSDGQPLPSGTQRGNPGLQTGAAQMNRAAEAAMLGGAVGGMFAFFL